MLGVLLSGRAARWLAVTACTAFVSRWLSIVVQERPAQREPGPPAARLPAAARAEQQLADSRLWRWVERWIARRALAPFRVQPSFRPLRVLNLDHGPGGIACALAGQAPQDAVVVAVDAVPGMAELARHRAARRLMRRQVHFVRAWPLYFPFAAESFDLVVSVAGMHQWPNAEVVLSEVRRVLRPDGRYLIVDFRRDLSLPLWILARILQSLVTPRDLRAAGEPGRSIAAAYVPHEAEWLAARAKLPDLRVEPGPAWLAIQPATPRV
jgi:SAM-dependent methyltransferase